MYYAVPVQTFSSSAPIPYFLSEPLLWLSPSPDLSSKPGIKKNKLILKNWKGQGCSCLKKLKRKLLMPEKLKCKLLMPARIWMETDGQG